MSRCECDSSKDRSPALNSSRESRELKKYGESLLKYSAFAMFISSAFTEGMAWQLSDMSTHIKMDNMTALTVRTPIDLVPRI